MSRQAREHSPRAKSRAAAGVLIDLIGMAIADRATSYTSAISAWLNSLRRPGSPLLLDSSPIWCNRETAPALCTLRRYAARRKGDLLAVHFLPGALASARAVELR